MYLITTSLMCTVRIQTQNIFPSAPFVRVVEQHGEEGRCEGLRERTDSEQGLGVHLPPRGDVGVSVALRPCPVTLDDGESEAGDVATCSHTVDIFIQVCLKFRSEDTCRLDVCRA
jgi:hypothetical protein